MAAECKRLRRMVKHVHRRQYDGADAPWQELLTDGIVMSDARVDLTAAIMHATEAIKRKRAQIQGKLRTRCILETGGECAKSQTCKQRAATKRGVNAVMERVARGAIGTVAVGTGGAAEVLTSPSEVARECSVRSDQHISLMQPKWFQRFDVAVGHVVWAVGETVVGGTVQAIDDDGHCTVAIAGGGMVTSVYRQNICLKWQVGASVRVPAMAAPGGVSSLRESVGGVRAVGMSAAAAQADEDQRVRSHGIEREEVAGVEATTMVPTQEEAWELAALDRGSFDDTALLFRRGAAGRSCRARAVQGGVTEDDRQQLPPCFHQLLEHLQSPVSGLTGQTVRSKDFVNMFGDDGSPRVFDRTILRRKLGKIAKGKAPGYSGNGPGLYAAMPGG